MLQPTGSKAKPPRNRKLETARQALASPSGAPGMCMSRRELAEAANAYVWAHTGGRQRTNMTEHDIGRYERGEVHWPDRWRRLGLREVLGAGSDRELGFYPNRRTSTTATSHRHPTEPERTAADTTATVGPLPRAIDHDPASDAMFDGVQLSGTTADDGPRRMLLDGIAAAAAACGLLGASSGRRVGAADVDRLSAITALYRSIDYEHGGGILCMEVGSVAESVSALLDQTYSEAVRHRLLAAVAAIRQVAGWTAFDSRRHSDAQRHLLVAERLAVAAGDMLLAARVRYCQARQFQHLRHNRDALDTLRLARGQLDLAATAAVRAMLDGAEAASLAALGDGKQALALLGRAEDGFSNIDLDREPDWMHFYDRGELLAQYGRVYRDMARVDRRHGRLAVQATSEAIGAFGPRNARSSVLNEVGLCSALFLADEPEQAVLVGTRVIEQARDMASPRIFDRLRNVRHDLARHEAVPEVADFSHTLATVGSGSPG